MKVASLEKLVKLFEDNNYMLYKVGGCVRDKLLKRENHDIDLVTNATPDQIEKLCYTTQVGKQFGISIVPTEDGNIYEIATFRKDGEYKDGRHPDKIEFSSMEEDAFRRDLTINALYEDFNGKIYDPTGKGLNDIKDHLIRLCAKDNLAQSQAKRIKEDKLRLLRVVRFYATLPNFRIESTTDHVLIFESMKKNPLEGVSPERIGIEARKIINGSNVVKALKLLENLNLLHYVFPFTNNLVGVLQNPKWHSEGDAWDHTLLTIKECKGNYLDKLTCLYHDTGKRLTEARNSKGEIINPGHELEGAKLAEIALKALKFSNEEIAIIKESILNHMIIKDMLGMKNYQLWHLIKNKYFGHIITVAKADEKGKISREEFVSIDDQLKNDRVQFMLNNPIPEPLVTGKDLIQLGMKPDEIFSKVLKVAYKVQLNKNWTKEQLLKNCRGWR